MGLFSDFKKAGSGNPDNVLDNTTRDMVKAGSSIRGAAGIVERVSDTILSGAESAFLRDTGITTSRIGRGLLDLNRFAASISGTKYSADVTPSAKISKGGQKFVGLQYPLELGEYFMSFKFMKYERPNPMEAGKEIQGAMVYLPIPANLQETQGADWSTLETGILGSLANQIQASNGNMDVNAIRDQIKSIAAGSDETGGYLLSTLGLIASNHVPVPGPLSRFITREQIAATIQQFAGAVPNPNLSVMFNGPTLGTHTFSWRFHPTSSDESNRLKEVINEFRKRMLPGVKGAEYGPNVLAYPDMVQIGIHPQEAQEHMNRQFKKSVITNMNVNYAPNGIPSFFKGTKAPTVVEFTVHLQDIEYFLATDFGRAGEDFASISEMADQIRGGWEDIGIGDRVRDFFNTGDSE